MIKLVEQLKNIPSYKLRSFIGVIKCFFNKSFPVAVSQYQNLERIYACYDMNQVAHKKGEIYDSISDYFHNNRNDAGIIIQFNDLNLPQMVQLSFMLVCEATKSNCPPIWPLSSNVLPSSAPAEQEMLQKICEINLDWIDKLEKHRALQETLLDKLIQTGKTLADSYEKIDDIQRELRAIIVSADHILDQIEKANSDDADDSGLAQCKKNITDKLLTLLENAEKHKADLEKFKQSLKKYWLKLIMNIPVLIYTYNSFSVAILLCTQLVGGQKVAYFAQYALAAGV